MTVVKKEEDKTFNYFIFKTNSPILNTAAKNNFSSKEFKKIERNTAEILEQCKSDSTKAGLSFISTIKQYFIFNNIFAGPIEQVMTLAPNEEVEISFFESKSRTTETEKKQTFETRNSREASDKASSNITNRVFNSVTNSASTSTSVGASGGNAVVSVNASQNTQYSTVTNNTIEFVRNDLKELINKTVEESKTEISITTKVTEAETSTNTTTRKLKNQSNECLNLGIRKLYKNTVIQSRLIDSALSLKLIIDTPAKFLIGSKILSKHLYNRRKKIELSEIKRLPRSENFYIDKDFNFNFTLNLEMLKSEDGSYTIPINKIKAVRIIKCVVNATFDCTPQNSQVHLEISSSRETLELGSNVLSTSGFSFLATIIGPDLIQLRVLNNGRFFQKQVNALKNFKEFFDGRSYHLEYQFEYESENIDDSNLQDEYISEYEVELSKEGNIKQRPQEDLRFEERVALTKSVQEIINTAGQSNLNSLISETGHSDLFDLNELFYSILNYKAIKNNNYIVSQDMNPSRIGKSLGWDLQPDGDVARNQFLNANQIMVNIPIILGKEKEALEALKKSELITINDNEITKLVKLTNVFRVFRKVFDQTLKSSSQIELGNIMPPISASKINDELDQINIDDFDLSKNEIDLVVENFNNFIKKFSANPNEEKVYAQLFPIIDRYETVTSVDGFVYENIALS